MTLLGTLIYKKLKPELPLWKMGKGSSILCSLFSRSPLTLPTPHGPLTPAPGLHGPLQAQTSALHPLPCKPHSQETCIKVRPTEGPDIRRMSPMLRSSQNKNVFLLIPIQSPSKPGLPRLNIPPTNVSEVPSDVWLQPASL